MTVHIYMTKFGVFSALVMNAAKEVLFTCKPEHGNLVCQHKRTENGWELERTFQNVEKKLLMLALTSQEKYLVGTFMQGFAVSLYT
jgi:hypothetical protein